MYQVTQEAEQEQAPQLVQAAVQAFSLHEPLEPACLVLFTAKVTERDIVWSPWQALMDEIQHRFLGF